jgi:hypothetical protein
MKRGTEKDREGKERKQDIKGERDGKGKMCGVERKI